MISLHPVSWWHHITAWLFVPCSSLQLVNRLMAQSPELGVFQKYQTDIYIKQQLSVHLEVEHTVWRGARSHRLLTDVIACWWALGCHNGLHLLLLLSCWSGLGVGFHSDCSFLNTSWRRDNWRKWRGSYVRHKCKGDNTRWVYPQAQPDLIYFQPAVAGYPNLKK